MKDKLKVAGFLLAFISLWPLLFAAIPWLNALMWWSDRAAKEFFK